MPPMRHLSLGLLCLFVLTACSRHSPPPTSPAAPLGLVEISFTVEGDRVSSSAVWLEPDGLTPQSLTNISGGLQFDPNIASLGSFEFGGERYLHATYRVRNADVNGNPYPVARQNVTLVAARTADTLANTAVRRFRLFDGSDAPAALVQSVRPTHGMNHDPLATAVTVDATRADLQVFSAVDLATLAPNEASVLNLFPYGFVLRNPAGGRTLAANPAPGQYDGQVTIAVKLPQQANVTDNPFTLSMLFLVAEDSVTQVTQSLEEQDNEAVLARAAALGASRINTLVGTRLAADAGRRLVCGVLLAGSPAAPERYLVGGAILSSSNLQVATASYLGGAANDTLTELELSPADCSLVISGLLSGQNFGVTPTNLLGGGNGVVLRLSPDGTLVRSVTRLPNEVRALAVNPQNGRILVGGAFGLLLLSPQGDSILWSANPGNVSRVATAGDGVMVALVGNTISTYGAGGNLLGQWTLGDTRVADIAYSSVAGLVYATGDHQASADYRSPYLRAYTTSGSQVWLNWRWSAADAQGRNLGADSVGRRVSIGRDGKLYLAGTLDGGNSVFARNPRDLSLNAPLVNTDTFTNTSNSVGARTYMYIARIEPFGGMLESSQIVVTRLSDGTANSISPSAITADERGNIYVSGTSACCLQNRTSLFLNGQAVGSYRLGEGFVLSVSPTFTRRLWMVFSSETGAATNFTGVTSGSGIVGVGGTVSSGTKWTFNALQALPGGGNDGYIGVWSGE